MESWGAVSVVRVLDVWRATLFHTVNVFEYKGGTFKGLISEATPAFGIIDIFLNSNRLSTQEKELFGRVRRMLLAVTSRGPRVPADDLLIIPVSQANGNDCVSRGMESTPEMWITGQAKVTKGGLERESAMAATHALAKEFKVSKGKTEGPEDTEEKCGDGAVAQEDLVKDKTNKTAEEQPNVTSKEPDFEGAFLKNLRRAFFPGK